jgi:CheY-like chemotaxis protein
MEVIGQLAGGVAHDFNNILAVIMGYSDLTLQKFGENEEIRSALETIRSTAQRAAGLTRQLLIFSRKQIIQPSVLDLNAVMQGMDKMLRRLIDENIEMKMVPGKEIGRVKADSGYVGQVLMNLVINARDAMPNGGKLTIATNNATLDENYARTHTGASPGDYVMLRVSDTGTGMTDDVKAHLFEAFFTTKPKGKGTGLGLATCQTIVQQSGGHIGLESEVGQGTTFKVYFPQVDLPLEDAATPVQAGALPRGTETVLLVEDEPSVRHLACDVLEAQGYHVLRAGDGQEGLRVARDCKGQPISLVITDVIMPVMGGKVMSDWLRTSYPNLKILFTSGYTDDAVTGWGMPNAIAEFMPKPYLPATLVRKVREMLDAPIPPIKGNGK